MRTPILFCLRLDSLSLLQELIERTPPLRLNLLLFTRARFVLLHARQIVRTVVNALGWNSCHLTLVFALHLSLDFALSLICQTLVQRFEFEAILECVRNELPLLLVDLPLCVDLDLVVVEWHFVEIRDFFVDGVLNGLVRLRFGIACDLDCPHLRRSLLCCLLVVEPLVTARVPFLVGSEDVWRSPQCTVRHVRFRQLMLVHRVCFSPWRLLSSHAYALLAPKRDLCRRRYLAQLGKLLNILIRLL